MNTKKEQKRERVRVTNPHRPHPGGVAPQFDIPAEQGNEKTQRDSSRENESLPEKPAAPQPGRGKEE